CLRRLVAPSSPRSTSASVTPHSTRPCQRRVIRAMSGMSAPGHPGDARMPMTWAGRLCLFTGLLNLAALPMDLLTHDWLFVVINGVIGLLNLGLVLWPA